MFWKKCSRWSIHPSSRIMHPILQGPWHFISLYFERTKSFVLLFSHKTMLQRSLTQFLTILIHVLTHSVFLRKPCNKALLASHYNYAKQKNTSFDWTLPSAGKTFVWSALSEIRCLLLILYHIGMKPILIFINVLSNAFNSAITHYFHICTPRIRANALKISKSLAKKLAFKYEVLSF